MDRASDGLISVEEAISRVLEGILPLNSEQVSISEAFGRVLAIEEASRVTQPPLAVSAMDGYAVRASDVLSVPITLTQVGEAAAGAGFDGSIRDGETVRIFTGAPIPEGANAIVIQEDTKAKGDKIVIKSSVEVGQFVRPKGLDFEKGQVLLSAGTRLNSRHVALASAMNIPWLYVRRKPRIAILPTGDELVMPGEPLKPGQIISSNSLGLSAFVNAAGGVGVNLGIAQDNSDSIRNLISNVKGADMLVTIGGASVGDYDLIKTVLSEEGLNITFSRVAMRPGKPLIFGQIHGKPMLGLPGNPVSAGVTALLFLKPAIDLMLGRPNQNEPKETAVLGLDLESNDQRQDYLRSTLVRENNGELHVMPFERQDSSMLAIFTDADCLVVRKPFAQPALKGDRVPIIRLDPNA